MTLWYRQHSDSFVYRMPWNLPSQVAPQATVMGLRLAACGTTFSAEDRGVDEAEDPRLDDRCAWCQGEAIKRPNPSASPR